MTSESLFNLVIILMAGPVAWGLWRASRPRSLFTVRVAGGKASGRRPRRMVFRKPRSAALPTERSFGSTSPRRRRPRFSSSCGTGGRRLGGVRRGCDARGVAIARRREATRTIAALERPRRVLAGAPSSRWGVPCGFVRYPRGSPPLAIERRPLGAERDLARGRCRGRAGARRPWGRGRDCSRRRRGSRRASRATRCSIRQPGA
jgi:hypothetical protein